MSDDLKTAYIRNRYALIALAFIFVLPFFIALGLAIHELLSFDGICWTFLENMSYACSFKQHVLDRILNPYAIFVYISIIGIWVTVSSVMVIMLYLIRQIIGFFKNMILEMRRPSIR